MIELKLDKCDARNAANLIETYFFLNIRECEDIDNIEYVRSLLRCLDELRAASR